MKTIKTLILGIAGALAVFGQLNTIIQTTTSSAMTAAQNFVIVASATGINAPTAGIPGSQLYIMDKGQLRGEIATVTTVSGTTIGIRRTQGGFAGLHASGANVLVATSPNWFYSSNPSGTCVTGATFVTPWINVTNGWQWHCSTVTSSTPLAQSAVRRSSH